MKKLIAAVAFLLVSFAASASGLAFDAGATRFFHGYNGQPAAVTGAYVTGQIGALNALSDGVFSATYLGSEASDANSFDFAGIDWGGNALTAHSTVGDTISASTRAGIVGFEFVDSTRGRKAIILNGAKPANYAASFLVLDANRTLNVGGRQQMFDYILGFNDGAPGSADYDDLMVGVNFRASLQAGPRAPSAVPLPAAAWLFGSAVFGFVAVSSRRKV